MPVVIETEAENERMLVIVEKLMDKGEAISAEERLVKAAGKAHRGFRALLSPSRRDASRSVTAPDGSARGKTDSFMGSAAQKE
jgi:hypothetical protein